MDCKKGDWITKNVWGNVWYEVADVTEDEIIIYLNNPRKERVSYNKNIPKDEPQWIVRKSNEVFVKDAEIYKKLFSILKSAARQATDGKGKERHATGEPFENQIIVEVGKRLSNNPAAGPLQNAVKKIYESGVLFNLQGLEAAIDELYGAINYIAAGIIVFESYADELDKIQDL